MQECAIAVPHSIVMPANAGIHDFGRDEGKEAVDARLKAGHDV